MADHSKSKKNSKTEKKQEEDSNSSHIDKFPRTRHLFDAGGGVGRDDLLLSNGEALAFLKNPLIIEEKVDGANLGISIDPEDFKFRFQNRSHWVTSQSSAQWKTLDIWLQQHSASLSQVLTPGRLILFGEWLYAQHSIHYSNLPGYFMAFDIWDSVEKKFYSVAERNKLLSETEIPIVARLDAPTGTGTIYNDLNTLKAMLQNNSKFYNGPLEGIYLRIDDGKWLKERAKVVRADFLHGAESSGSEVEHWSKKQLVKNIVRYD